jgi:hypothetical protein
METKTYKDAPDTPGMDNLGTRADWPPGPWDDEPDKMQWQDSDTGLPCLIVRNHSGALCGYVGVPEGHPWHGKDYEHVGARVHGGITYANHCQAGPEEHAICHVPAPGEPDTVWWLGFDCAHSGDYCPGLDAALRKFREMTPALRSSAFTHADHNIYRDIAYVKAECASLARQAKEAA